MFSLDFQIWTRLGRFVAAGLRPAVEPGILPGGISARCFEQLFRATGRAPYKAGETPAATRFMDKFTKKLTSSAGAAWLVQKSAAENVLSLGTTQHAGGTPALPSPRSGSHLFMADPVVALFLQIQRE